MKRNGSIFRSTQFGILLTFFVVVHAGAVEWSEEEKVWLDQHPTIPIGIMDAWPPMDYVDSSGNPQGVGVEIIHQLNLSLNGRLKIVPGNWKQNYEAVKNRALPALMDITPKLEREPYFNFTAPYITVPHNIFTRSDHPIRKELADLAGDTVGIEQGFFLVNVIHELYPQINVIEFDNTSDALDALTKGEVDAYVGNRAVAVHIINNELIANLKVQGKVKETSSVNAIGVRKDWPILRDILDKALAEIPESEHQEIRLQWMGAINRGFDYTLLFKFLVPAALLIAILIFWNRQLQWMVKRRTARLAELTSLQGAMLEQAGYAIIATDTNAKIKLFNRAAEELLGYRSDEVIGTMTLDRFHLPTELVERAAKYGARLGVTLKPGIDTLFAYSRAGRSNQHEYTYVHKDGSLIPVMLSVSIMIDEVGKELGFLGIALDIRKRKKAEQALLMAKEEAVAANLAKDDFLATMSHELRTPLTTIIGNSELIAEELIDSHQKELVDSIIAAGRNQLALVNDILDVSKIESGKFTIDESPFDLAVLLDEIRCMFAIRANGVGLDFVLVQGYEEKNLLNGDGQRIAQILINLIGNAIKFTQHGKITLEVMAEGDQIQFRVIDTGIGMTVEVQEQLFKRFQQADNTISRRFGGTGMGLYISKSLAEMMGGTITVNSETGKGSTFTLSLPYRPVSAMTNMDQANQEDREPNSEQNVEGVVLVAEDTPAFTGVPTFNRINSIGY